VEVGEKSIKELSIFQDRRGNKLFIAELERQPKSLVQSLDIYRNKHLYAREHELKEEIEKLKSQINQMKMIRNTVDLKNLDSEFFRDSQLLVLKFKDKVLDLDNQKKKKYNFEKNSDNINKYDKQIEFLQNKEGEMKENLKKLGDTLDVERLRTKLNQQTTPMGNYEEEKKDSSSKRMEEKEIESSTTLGGSGAYDKARVVRVDDLIDRVNSELQIQKYNIVNDQMRFQETFKKKDKKKKKYVEYITIFERVQEVAKNMVERNFEKERQNDTESTMNKLEEELPSFKINTLKNIDKGHNYDCDSLIDNIKKAKSNLDNLEQKIANLSISKRNEYGKKISKIFNSNIILSKQNNTLMEKVIEYSKGFYNIIFDRLIYNENPQNFNDIKEKVDEFKASLKDDNPISDDEDHIEGYRSDDSI
jgi:predicted transposase YbfD/YdcC